MTGSPWSVARTEISLAPRIRAFSFLFTFGCLALFMAGETALVGLVSLFQTPSVGRLLLPFDAQDPQLQDRLGLVSRDDKPDETLRYLRRAVQLSPKNRLYWEHLEMACEDLGNAPCAGQASERLVQLCPLAPAYHWLAAQSYLRTNHLDLAYGEYRRLLDLDPRYAVPALTSLQDIQKPEAIFRNLLAGTRNGQLKVDYIDFLSSQNDNDTAYRLWKLAVAEPVSFPFSSAAPYLDRLIAVGRIQEAVNVWEDLERQGIVASSAANEKGNLVYNGDFERKPLNAGFDWRTLPATYLAVDFSAPGAYHGARCLRVDFTVARNEEYEPALQVVPVRPLHDYVLEAFVRSEDLASDSGPRLRVSDIQSGGFPDAISETMVGTTPWHVLRLSFFTGPHTQAVRLSFWRPRSRVFPTEISGTCWLDAVSLKASDKQ